MVIKDSTRNTLRTKTQAIERRYSIIGDSKMICRMLSMSEILTDERAGDLVCRADFTEVNPITNHNQRILEKKISQPKHILSDC